MESNESTNKNLRRLIWAYFWLLIFEGALRKWALPGLSNVLLIIRDPVLIALLGYAFYKGQFPTSKFIVTLTILGILSLIAGCIALNGNVVVPLFGWRTNFLHLLLMFVMAKTMTIEDAGKFGKWMMILAAPMAFLMALQFRSSSGAWINAGAGEGASQIAAVEGRIRPAGTFTYNTGVALLFSLTAAFTLYRFLTKQIFPVMLATTAGVAILAACAVSGSRAFLASIAIVVFFGMITIILRPNLMLRGAQLATLAALVVFALGSLSFFQDGVGILKKRIDHASNVEGGFAGFADRVSFIFTEPLNMIADAPLLGHGLGLGTNAGAALVSGSRGFLLAETEWSRIILESGPVLGLFFVVWRLWFVVWLGWRCVRVAAFGHVLPLLLFGASALNILAGQFGQPTALGFAAFSGGLCLCAMRSARPSEFSDDDSDQPDEDDIPEVEKEPSIAG